MVRVKICGLTRLEDAKAALEYGADYLGFILYPPSPRAVTTATVAHIVRQLKAADPSHFSGPNSPRMVGVFVNENPTRIAETLDQCGLDLAQLSGNEDAGHVMLSDSPIYGRAYKAIRPRSEGNEQANIDHYANLANSMEPFLPSLLLDTPHGQLYGGSGEVGDWGLAAKLVAKIPRVMLAGGLTPENVSDAIREVRPFAVDVASGVEASPGIKDHELIHSFIRNATRY